jgi:CheY-like chemotaxis protein
VFEMFSQLEPALDRARGGLGIGLALVRGIVALHGGSVHADSAGPGRGSEFTVRLPLAAAGAACAPRAAAPADAAPPAALRVLVVDDNRDAAELLTMALDLSGCQTLIAHTAGAALELAAGFQPQVGLLDIGLPDMNGYELARRLRLVPGCESGLVLIAATGWGQDKDRQRAFEAGFDHHLTKPIDFDQLRQLLPGVQA